jgi:hypothetical protein
VLFHEKKTTLYFLLASVLVGSILNGISVVYSTEDHSLLFPTGVAVDSSSNVYVIDSWNDSIQKFTSDGKFITKWGSRGLDDGQFFNPVSVAVDSLSNVYVVDQGNDRIQKFTSDGKFITTWGIQRSDDGNFFNPKGVAVDSSSNVYVVDQNNNRIQKFTSDGKFITKWAIKASDDDQIGPPLRSPSEGPSGIAVDSKAGKLYVIVKNEQIQSICCSIYLPGK